MDFAGRVCSQHFRPTQFEDQAWLKNLLGDSANIRVRLKHDAIPMEYVEDNDISAMDELNMYKYSMFTICSDYFIFPYIKLYIRLTNVSS